MVMAVMGDDGQNILGYCIPFSKLHKYVSACGIILPQKPLQALQIACNTRSLQWVTPLKYVAASTLGVWVHGKFILEIPQDSTSQMT